MSKKGIILLIILFVTVACGAFLGLKEIDKLRYNKSYEAGMQYLSNKKYDDALEQFNKCAEVKKSNDITEIEKVVEKYKNVVMLYNNKDYRKAKEELDEISKSKYAGYIIETDMKTNIEKKLNIINNIDELDKRVENLNNDHKYDEAEKLINSYKNKEVGSNYDKKLVKLLSSVLTAKTEYENKQKAIAAQKEMIKKKAENEKKPSGTSNKEFTAAEAAQLVRRVKNIPAKTHVDCDHVDDHNGEYVVHVYDVVEDPEFPHTATYGWYYVNKKTHKITNAME